MELCTGGELYDDLINREQYTERDAAKLFFQMVASIAYVHRRGIAHRDLKLENFIFQSKSENSPLKLIDFGMSGLPLSSTHARYRGTVVVLHVHLLTLPKLTAACDGVCVCLWG